MTKKTTAPKTSKKIAIKQPTDAEVKAHVERKRADEAAKAEKSKPAKKGKAPSNDEVRDALAGLIVKSAEAEKPAKPYEHDERVLAVYPIGSVMTKEYKRRDRKDAMIVEITVDAEGFVYNGKLYKSLSAIGNILTGWNSTDGMRFFGFTKRAPKPKAK